MFRPRRPISPASKLVVPINALFGIILGLIYSEQDKSRTSRLLDGVHKFGLSSHSAGLVLIVLGCVILTGMVTGYVDLAAVGCLAAGAAWLVLAWTLRSPGPLQSQSAPVWPVYVGLIHLVSTVALLTNVQE